MGAKPRVTIVTPGSYPIPSGKSSSVENTVKQIGELMSNRVKLWVLGKKTAALPSDEVRDGVHYVRPERSGERRNYLSAISGAIDRLRPDIIQVENRPAYALALKRRYPESQVWLTLHSTTFLAPKRIEGETLKKALSQSDRIIVNSHFLKDHVTKRYPHTAKKIRVNYLGVDTKRFISKWSREGERMRKELLKELQYEQKKILLYVGRLIEIKGVHHALHALPKIIERHPDVVLVIVGSAEYGSNSVTSYVKSLHALGNRMPRNVRFVPYVPHDEVHRWYALADALIMPSFEQEAFGLVNVEAMASGVPVIATRAGDMKELIVHGQTGFLVSPNRIVEKIVEKANLLLENPELAKKMGEASIRRVKEHFTWEHAAGRLVEWYCESADRSSREETR